MRRLSIHVTKFCLSTMKRNHSGICFILLSSTVLSHTRKYLQELLYKSLFNLNPSYFDPIILGNLSVSRSSNNAFGEYTFRQIFRKTTQNFHKCSLHHQPRAIYHGYNNKSEPKQIINLRTMNSRRDANQGKCNRS